MSKQKNRYYVVWEGAEKGIYTSWEDCRQRVEGFTGAKYKGFVSLEEARVAFSISPQQISTKPQVKPESRSKIFPVGQPIMNSISVDAACSGNPGALEYRGVYTETGVEIFHRGPFPEGTINIGEFLAIVTGLVWLKQNKLTIPLYSDSYNGLLWVQNKRMNTKLQRSSKNEELFCIVDKAMEWLKNNSCDNLLLKWVTSAWGEIPADFGRK